jgi:hypothetical protein
MNAIVKIVMAVCLFLGAWLCIFGYQSEKLIQISTLWSMVCGLSCAALFVYFAFIDIRKQ